MNETVHGWVTTLLTLPLPAWAAIASALVGAAIPWLVEANVPMADWSGWRFRLITYAAACFAGLVAGITIWHSWSAFVLWAPALVVNMARDIASHFLPWLSPRRQQVIQKLGADGRVGYQILNDETGTYDPTLYPGRAQDQTIPKEKQS